MNRLSRFTDILHLAVTLVYIAGATAFDLFCYISHDGKDAGLLLFPALAAVSLLVFFLRGPVRRAAKKVYNVVIITVCSLALIFAATFAWYYIYAETYVPQPPDGSVDAVIVLGATAYGATPSMVLAYRLDAALIQLKKYPDAVCVASGGQGPNETAPEAAAMFAYLTARGVDPGRILQETNSSSTLQNLRNSINLMDKQGVSHDCVMIATSDYHVPRALMIAHRLGLNAYAASAYIIAPRYTQDAIREYFAVIKSWLVDW